MRQKELRGIPSVSRLLEAPELRSAMASHGRALPLALLGQTLDEIRHDIANGAAPPEFGTVVERIVGAIDALTHGGLLRVINATGVLLHTNLGRAPLGRGTLNSALPALEGYSNLEFRLETGERGRRMEHLAPLLQLVTGAEDALAVNNNAAAVMLALHTFARDKEVITSRGELIEIGGSFRMPDIIATSGARLVEVGTTNRTRLADYERAITTTSSVILKSHCSNYRITGFSEETSIQELAGLAKARGLLLLHDIGSGLLSKSSDPALRHEPDVQHSLAAGADLVMFSCDKLLGGTQAGVLAGRAQLIATLASQPMLRALRLDKVAIALLRAIVLQHLRADDGLASGGLAALSHRSPEQRRAMAEQLASLLTAHGIGCTVIASSGCHGGGSIPGRDIESHAVRIDNAGTGASVDQLTRALRLASTPIVAVPREGRLCLDVLAMFDDDLQVTADMVVEALCAT